MHKALIQTSKAKHAKNLEAKSHKAKAAQAEYEKAKIAATRSAQKARAKRKVAELVMIQLNAIRDTVESLSDKVDGIRKDLRKKKK